MSTYHVFSKLGSGGFSTVYRCMRKQTGEEFALKIVPKNILLNSADLERFQREINTLSLLHHPNLVSMIDLFDDDDNFYIVTDLCEGGDLFKIIKKTGKFNEETALEIFQQLVSALSYLHGAGVAHRDLKPENVLVTQFPEIKLADFGLCDYTTNLKHTRNESCGSLWYSSPESLFRCSKDLEKSDIWSLGVILYTMVVGRLPWNANNESIMMRQIVKGTFSIPAFLSDSCRELISKMLLLDPNKRISLQEITEHKWFTSKTKFSLLKNKKSISLFDLAVLAEHDSKEDMDMGIFNPIKSDEKQNEKKSKVKFQNHFPRVTNSPLCKSRRTCSNIC